MKEPKATIHERDPTPDEVSAPSPGKLTIQFDAREFAHFLEESDLTEDQKLEYIQTIWQIVLQFIDMGFGIHPIQQACGQFDDETALYGGADSDMVELPHSDFCKDFKRVGKASRTKQIPHIQGGETP